MRIGDPSNISKAAAIRALAFVVVGLVFASWIFDWGILRLLFKILVALLKGL